MADLSPDDIDDMEAARQLARLSFEDYLAHSTNFYGRRMSIKFSKTKVNNIIDLIKEFSGINISISEKVNNEVSINLKNVPWDQALITVLQSAQLGYIMQGSIIRVAPITDIRDERKLAAEAMEDYVFTPSLFDIEGRTDCRAGILQRHKQETSHIETIGEHR